MALDPKAEAALALHRFGLGPRAGSIAAIASDPRGALLAEINSPDAGRINDPALPASGEGARAAFKFQQEQRAARLAERPARDANSTNARNGAPPEMKAPDGAAPP